MYVELVKFYSVLRVLHKRLEECLKFSRSYFTTTGEENVSILVLSRSLRTGSTLRSLDFRDVT